MRTLTTWTQDECEFHPDSRTLSRELYESFLRYIGCSTALERARFGMSAKRFTQSLLRLYPTQLAMAKSGRRYVVGIALRATPQPVETSPQASDI